MSQGHHWIYADSSSRRNVGRKKEHHEEKCNYAQEDGRIRRADFVQKTCQEPRERNGSSETEDQANSHEKQTRPTTNFKMSV